MRSLIVAKDQDAILNNTWEFIAIRERSLSICNFSNTPLPDMIDSAKKIHAECKSHCLLENSVIQCARVFVSIAGKLTDKSKSKIVWTEKEETSWRMSFAALVKSVSDMNKLQKGIVDNDIQEVMGQQRQSG